MKAVIRVRDVEISLDGSTAEILSAVRSLIAQNVPLALPAGPAQSEDAPTVLETSTSDRVAVREQSDVPLPEARSFFELKKPTNNREATAVAAYYLREVAPEAERSRTVSKEQLVSVFREGRWKLPARPEQTLVDTEAAGYLKRTDRGIYELTNTGHNLVVHTLGTQE